MDKKTGGDKFSNHPCHRLSVPSAKRFWCRHCFEMFDDAISRWRHSKGCKNTTLSNMTRRKEQEATAMEAFCESTGAVNVVSEDRPVTLPSLNPKSTLGSYAGPREDNIVELSCFICKREFSSMDEMKAHVRVPCNKVSTSGGSPFSFGTGASKSNAVHHRSAGRANPPETVLELIDDTKGTRQSSSPLDPANLSSETMAAVEALNMMARSDNVNLTQFLNQLSEGGFVIEQAAGTSAVSGSQDREIIFTVQGDGSESGALLQDGGDITVEVAEDLIRMAQRVRVEAVEHIVEEQVQEEVVQDLELHTEVHYINDQSELAGGTSEYVEEQTQEAEQAQLVEQTETEVEEAQVVEENLAEFIHIECPQGQEAVVGTNSTFTIVNLESGKEYSEMEVTGTAKSSEMDSPHENAEVDVQPLSGAIIAKQEGEDQLSIPGEKRKREEEGEEAEGQEKVKVENGSQVKKLCTEVVTDQNVPECSTQEESFEAKKKLQFFSECLIVQEKCNKNSENSCKNTLETVSSQECDKFENLPNLSTVLAEDNTSHSSITSICLHFLDEVDGVFKPMTEEMMKVQEPVVDISPLASLMTDEFASSDDILTVIKDRPSPNVFSLPCKASRSSSRKLVLTPKKLRLLEEKERRIKKITCTSTVTTPVTNKKSKKSSFNRESIKTSLKVETDVMDDDETFLNSNFNPSDIKTKPAETVVKPVEKPKKAQTRSLKCRACDKVFNTERQLVKHKSVPCVVKVTRNMCQNILRPKRALPRLPGKRIVKKKPMNKASRKPKLLPVGLHATAQWSPCNRDQKPSRGRGRPRKYTVDQERKKHIVLPDRTLEVSSLSAKEQFFFELALVCSDHILVKPKVDIATLLTVGVDDKCDSLSVSDISPPILEKIDPHSLNTSVSEQPPDLTCSEELDPPLLEPMTLSGVTELDQRRFSKECYSAVLLPRLESDSNQDRHFLDSFPSDRELSHPIQSENSKEVAEIKNVKSIQDSQSPVFDRSRNKIELMENLKSKLKHVCSPKSANSSPSCRKTRPDIASNTSPRSKRNLFDALQTLCLDCSQVSDVGTGPASSLSASILCAKLKASNNRNLSPRKNAFSPSPRKTSSIHSSPRKMPNILLRRSSSETGSKERSACILGAVAQSMGINVLNLSPTSSNSREPKPEHMSAASPLVETTEAPVLTLPSPSENGKKSLFKNSELVLSENSHVPILHILDENRGNRSLISKLSPSKPNNKLLPVKPMIAMSNLQSGQILVSPIQAGSSTCPVKYDAPCVSEASLCSDSAQRPPPSTSSSSSSPVDAVLDHLELKLYQLKSAIQHQTGSGSGSSSKLTEKKLASVILDDSREHHSRATPMCSGKCGVNLPGVNLPDVVRSVTENRNLSCDLAQIHINSSHSKTPPPILNSCKEESAVDFPENACTPSQDSATVRLSQNPDLTESPKSTNVIHPDSDFNESPSDGTVEGSNRVKVQYIKQLDSTRPNGLTYLLIQQDGADNDGSFTSCLSPDFNIDSGRTFHPVNIEEEEVLTDSLPSNLYNANLARSEREISINLSGF